MSKAKKTISQDQITSSIAKNEDGTIQITFSIPVAIVRAEESHALEHLKNDVVVPGFRKGKAPLEKVKQKIEPEKLLQHTLGHILPSVFGKACDENKLRPAIYPKFELISKSEDKDGVWQIRAVTCEIPNVEVEGYKDIAKKALKELPKEATAEQKQEKIIDALLQAYKVQIPKVLTEEEVNGRLAQLLERIEKLGLTLDSYLSSVGKNVESIREEYTTQTNQSIALELILNKIAEIEKIDADSKEVESAFKAIEADPGASKNIGDESKKAMVVGVLKRRSALDRLITTA